MRLYLTLAIAFSMIIGSAGFGIPAMAKAMPGAGQMSKHSPRIHAHEPGRHDGHGHVTAAYTKEHFNM